jgi:hypothetical protein
VRFRRDAVVRLMVAMCRAEKSRHNGEAGEETGDDTQKGVEMSTAGSWHVRS